MKVEVGAVLLTAAEAALQTCSCRPQESIRQNVVRHQESIRQNVVRHQATSGNHPTCPCLVIQLRHSFCELCPGNWEQPLCRRGDGSEQTPCLEVLVEPVNGVVDQSSIRREERSARELMFEFGLHLADLLLGGG